MKPKFFGFEEGFRIYLSQAPTKDPTLQYRRAVEQAAKLSLGTGEISEISQQTLTVLRDNLGIPRRIADQIAYEVLEPYRKKQQSLQNYEQALKMALSKEYPLLARSESELRHLQSILGLQNEDIKPIHSRFLSERESSSFLTSSNEENQNHLEPDISITPQLPTAGFTSEVSSSIPASPLLACSIQENLENERDRIWSFSITTLLIASCTFIATITLSIFAYQYLLEGKFREPAIALQPAPLSSSAADGIDKLVIRLQELKQEGESSGHRAWRLYTEDGDIDGAIEELKQILPASSEYDDAQERLTVWPAAFERNRQNLQLSQAALSSGNLTRAENHARALDRTQPYWQKHRQELLTQISQERARIERQSERLICSTRNRGIRLIQFRVDAEDSPIISVSGEPETDTYLLVSATKVRLTRPPDNSQVQDLASGLIFVEVKEGPYVGEKGWVDSSFLCPLSN